VDGRAALRIVHADMCDALRHVVVRYEAVLASGAHDAAARNRKSHANQLAEVGALASGYGNVMPTDTLDVEHQPS